MNRRRRHYRAYGVEMGPTEDLPAGWQGSTAYQTPGWSMPSWSNPTGEPLPGTSYVGPGDADSWPNLRPPSTPRPASMTGTPVGAAGMNWSLLAGAALLAVAAVVLLKPKRKSR